MKLLPILQRGNPVMAAKEFVEMRQIRHADGLCDIGERFAVGNERAGGVIQALRHLGQRAVDKAVIQKLRTILNAKDKRDLVRDARQSADWIYAAARAIAEGDS